MSILFYSFFDSIFPSDELKSVYRLIHKFSFANCNYNDKKTDFFCFMQEF